MARRKPAEPKAWRNHLTPSESQVLKFSDAAKADWDRLKRERANIISAATQRARDAKKDQTK